MNDKIDWKRKLTSRKLWIALASLVTNLILAFGGGEAVAVQVTAIIMSGAAVVAYIVGEGLVDAANKDADITTTATSGYVFVPDDDTADE